MPDGPAGVASTSPDLTRARSMRPMPELTPQSTTSLSLYAAPPAGPPEPPGPPPAAPPPPEPSGPENGSQGAATPPTIDPAAWEDFAAFRETFLMYLTPPGYAAALRTVGEMLHTMILESYNPWPGWPESSTRTEMRAALADLRHLQGFLASVGREKELSSLDAEDAYLSQIAGKLSRQIKHAADGIERELQGSPEMAP